MEAGACPLFTTIHCPDGSKELGVFVLACLGQQVELKHGAVGLAQAEVSASSALDPRAVRVRARGVVLLRVCATALRR